MSLKPHFLVLLVNWCPAATMLPNRELRDRLLRRRLKQQVVAVNQVRYPLRLQLRVKLDALQVRLQQHELSAEILQHVPADEVDWITDAELGQVRNADLPQPR